MVEHYCKKCGKKLSSHTKPHHPNDICTDCFMEENKRYCKECGTALSAFGLTAYSKYLCPGCELER
jgi:hypothetical protein